MAINLHLLFVEDDSDDFRQIHRQITEYFEQINQIEVHIDGKENFEDAMTAVNNPHIRHDLIISDTYKGDHAQGDAAVLELIDAYKENDKFCPLIICSSGVCPAELESSAFVNWVEKDRPENLEQALNEILELGIPQLARTIHDEIDSTAGDFLWSFLEKNWESLIKEAGFNPDSLERLIRSRAAMVLNDLVQGGGSYSGVTSRHGLEYYIYPSLEHDYYNLGDIIVNKEDENNIRVILTPHCHLYIREDGGKPKVDYVLTVKTVKANEIIGDALQQAKDRSPEAFNKKLAKYAQSPSETRKVPEGRHWYLPHFLKIPHLFCDFLQVESISYQDLNDSYERIATLTPPYAEAMQQSFASFYGSIGIPEIEPTSIHDMLE